jgi:hypothetical protein
MGESCMKLYLVVALLSVAIFALYGLDRGIYIGSKRYAVGSLHYPDGDYIQKRCRYVFVTGIAEIDAHGGQVPAPGIYADDAAFDDALKKPDNGYCRLFGE